MVARPAGGREVVGSNPAAPTMVKENDLIRKVLILLFILVFSVIACGNDRPEIYEPVFTEDKIEFPFTELDKGKFTVIYRNYTEDRISYSLILASTSGSLLENSQDLDYCEGISAIRDGKLIKEWVIINFNYSSVSEMSIPNQEDHPNLVSYNLPKGTYILALQDSPTCNKDNYVIFDVKTNDAMYAKGE